MQLSIERTNLNDAVEAAIRDMIVDGAVEAGERLNEVRLAEQLGVSRTPLREALNRLVSEGAVVARPRLGYFVKPLTVEEFEQLYDIRPMFEPQALRLAGVPSPAQMDRLEKINGKLARTRNALAAMTLDDDWHFTLIAGCPNRVLVDLIRTIAVRTRRYELALMREERTPHQASDHHGRILDALKKNRMEAACATLKENLEYGKAAIVAWLQARAPISQAKRSA